MPENKSNIAKGVGGTTMKYSVYRADNLQNAMNLLLVDGAVPVSDLKQCWKMSKQEYVCSGIVFDKGTLRPVTVKECKSLKKLYDSGGFLLWVYRGSWVRLLSYRSSLCGINLDLHYGLGRVCGVKK